MSPLACLISRGNHTILCNLYSWRRVLFRLLIILIIILIETPTSVSLCPSIILPPLLLILHKHITFDIRCSSCQCTAVSNPFTQNIYQILWPSGSLARPCARSKMALRGSKKLQNREHHHHLTTSAMLSHSDWSDGRGAAQPCAAPLIMLLSVGSRKALVALGSCK